MSDAVTIAVIVLAGQVLQAIAVGIDNRRVLRLYETAARLRENQNLITVLNNTEPKK